METGNNKTAIMIGLVVIVVLVYFFEKSKSQASMPADSILQTQGDQGAIAAQTTQQQANLTAATTAFHDIVSLENSIVASGVANTQAYYQAQSAGQVATAALAEQQLAQQTALAQIEAQANTSANSTNANLQAILAQINAQKSVANQNLWAQIIGGIGSTIGGIIDPFSNYIMQPGPGVPIFPDYFTGTGIVN